MAEIHFRRRKPFLEGNKIITLEKSKGHGVIIGSSTVAQV
jgi:hypothetical protein